MTSYLKLVALALPLLVAGCASGPTRDVELSDKGYHAMVAGDMEKAETLLTQAVAENPNNPHALLNLGALYQNTGRAEEAVPLYERVLDIVAASDSESITEPRRKELQRLDRIARENLRLTGQIEAPEPESVKEVPRAEMPMDFPYWIQIGAFASSEAAEQVRRGFREQQRPLCQREIRVVRVNGLNKVRIGPYTSMDEARSVCYRLRSTGVGCFPGGN
ncbi:SPOR domain-containing protein [Thiohalomonas denitrificans]|uniref:SPOR domain-containing protein n=1 Tax=Thiohalomonas denitrificans TaxID=415747 RepID=UPI0026EE7FC4|nr:SPOR domain-containing protein [Thiohalomonas denitrificans]